MTLIELAQAAGVSKAAVSKNRKLPRAKNTDGTSFYDPSHPAVISYIANNKKRERVLYPRSTTEKPAKEMRSIISVRPINDPLRQQEYELDAENIRLKNEQIRLNIAMKRGDLVPVTLVNRFMALIYDADTEELKALANRVSSAIAGEARQAKSQAEASAKIYRILTTETDKILKHVHRVMLDFRKLDRQQLVVETLQEAVPND
jgi:hypothetical protein